jgi:hypothetical protein
LRLKEIAKQENDTTIGLAVQVGAMYNALLAAQRAHAAILTSVDGAARAIDIYGQREHLPQAISPHLNFRY